MRQELVCRQKNDRGLQTLRLRLAMRGSRPTRLVSATAGQATSNGEGRTERCVTAASVCVLCL